MFDRLPVPTPFQVGPVNAYLAGRTLVDPGPDSEDARAALADALAERSLAVADLERVLVTHPHPDHFGLAAHLREAGADVLASPATAAILRDFAGRLDYEQAYFTPLFEAHGLPPETVRTVTQLPEAFVEYAPSTEVDRELTAGAELAVEGTTVSVRALQGHAPGEVAFEFEASAGDAGAGSSASDGTHAIVGDQVLGDTTPNPFLQPPGDPAVDDATGEGSADTVAAEFDATDPAALDAARPRVLPAYNDSLDRLRAVGHDRLLPGHGEPIADPADRIDELRAAHEERTDAVRDALAGPTTAAEVMHELFPDLAVIDYFPGMSEAVGHLDVLEGRGEVEREVSAGELVYRLG